MATVGRRSITQRDIARSLGVSVSAVSLALSGRPGVSAELREQISSRATRLGYRPNASAVALRTRRSRVLGLLIRNLRNPFFLDLVDGFDAACAQAGYGVLVGSSRYDDQREQELLDDYGDRGVDGLAVAPIGPSRPVAAWRNATRRPVVLLNAPAQPGVRTMMSVRPDTAAGVDLAVAHLLTHGHRRLAMLVTPTAKMPDPERLERFQQLGRRHRFTARAVSTEPSPDDARAVVRDELNRAARVRPTAFIATSDHLALAIYQAATDLGLSVPGDVSVVGHDDLPTSAWLSPGLTTLRVDRRVIGERAARLLIDTVEGRRPAERDISVPVRLTVRDSTGPVP
jgi:DNA-binding LacI/PurR family transcriptional regulator